MKTPAQFILGLALAGMVTSAASAQTIVQNNPINIAAVVSVGGPAASVSQTGKYNYAGVVQSGVNTSASINQNGKVVNSGFIAQSGRNTTASINQSGGPRVNNAAAIGQYTGGYYYRRR
jgi:hypothetical protein